MNISPVQLRRRAFADHLLDLVGEWRNENIGIDIEITEGVLIDDVSSAVSQLRVLRRSGVRVAIDDFGTGYSSLSRLAELPVDMLKIDRSFISGLTSSGAGPHGGRDHHRAGPGLRYDHAWPKAWRHRSSSRCWRTWAATSRRAICTAARWPRPTSNPC